MDGTRIYHTAKEMMGEQRFQHTLGVIELAEKLARHYGLDAGKARLAALLHDCVRGWPEGQLLKKAGDFAIVVTEIDRIEPGLLHGPVAAELARRDFGITDADLLEAICRHTTGHEQMGELAKVIYVADSLEQGRDYPGVAQLRQMMYSGLDSVYLALLNHTLTYLIRAEKLIHPDSVRARNRLLLQRSSCR